MRMQRIAPLSVVIGLALAACADTEPLPAAAPPPVAPPPPSASVAAAPPATPAPNNPQGLDRATFNLRAAELNQPLYWVWDKNGDRAIQADELKSLLFYPTEGHWTENGQLSREFREMYDLMTHPSEPATKDAAELARRKLVVEDLKQGTPTLVYTDLTKLTASEKAFVGHILAASKAIDSLYAAQKGVDKMRASVPVDDYASQSLFRRNWGPGCVAPATENNPACSAIPGAPKPMVSVYPESSQKDPQFCQTLAKHKDAKTLLDHFSAVQEKDGKLVAVPYSKAYREMMEHVAAELMAANDALTDPAEKALKKYLVAAAQAFRDNNWTPADEAWAAMGPTNSKWYLRVAPDETYWEPCDHKAGFHLQFARINQASLPWQAKLTPVRTEMEETLASLIGAPYKARKVTFHLPDFIDVVINAGDARMPTGGVGGESLPNWGKLTEEGRARTVVMTNMFRDPDSLANRKAQASSVLSAESMASYSDEDAPGLVTTILHEATHNLGPAHQYKANGKTDAEALGGPLASMFEELKAQTGGLYYIDFAQKKGLIDPTLAKQAYTDAVVWAFGHIARGMYDENHKSKAYGQLAAIQVGFLMEQGALTWDAQAKAADGKSTGAFTIHMDKMPATLEALMKRVGAIKATGDKAGAEELVKRYVDGDVVPLKVIADREGHFPRPSFVYAIDI